jgi:hypothetical protein
VLESLAFEPLNDHKGALCEHPNLCQAFRLKNVPVEMALHVLACNMIRVVKIMGIPETIAAIFPQRIPSNRHQCSLLTCCGTIEQP